VLVDVPGKSGALITAEFALEQGRDVYVHRVSLIRPEADIERVQKYVADGAPVIESYTDYRAFKTDAPESGYCVSSRQMEFEGAGEWQQ
jgi:predicted Rossmann fold nucleotide-binding protein DprA/Smf involved in DNA uptake